MKIALVHDWLKDLSGAERVLIELHKMFPEAPIYTLFADKKFVRKYFPNAYVKPSFLQLIPGITKLYRKLLYLMPLAVETFNLSDYDLVISSSAIFSKGLVLKPKTRHICYCYSPTRQIWDLNTEPKTSVKEQKISAKISKHFLRIWDRQASDRADDFVAISQHVRRRIRKYYRRDAYVIYPPVKINTDILIKNEGYYLIVSRLYPHKNIDIAIEAFVKLNLPLVIVGSGPEARRLKKQSGNHKNIKFLGFVPDKKLPEYYTSCKAFIMPQEEDFGITPVEAMSFGKPVLALRKGGAKETVVEGVTGEFFDDPIPEALADGVRRLNENYNKYDSKTIMSQADKFSVEKFREEISKLVYNN